MITLSVNSRTVVRHLPPNTPTQILIARHGGMGDRVQFQAIVEDALQKRGAQFKRVVAAIPHHAGDYDAHSYTSSPDEIWVVPQAKDVDKFLKEFTTLARTILPEVEQFEFVMYDRPADPEDLERHEINFLDHHEVLTGLAAKDIYPVFTVGVDAYSRADTLLKGAGTSDPTGPLVAMHCRLQCPQTPSGGVKNPDPEDFISAIRFLRENLKARIVLLAGDEDLPAELESLVHLRVPQDQSLQLPAAILSCCDLFIGGDSGPIHLAAAVGLPSIIIRQNNPSWIQGPFCPDSMATHILATSTNEPERGLRFSPENLLETAQLMLKDEEMPKKKGKGKKKSAPNDEVEICYLMFNHGWEEFLVQRKRPNLNAEYKTSPPQRQYLKYLRNSLETLVLFGAIKNFHVKIRVLELLENNFSHEVEALLQAVLPSGTFSIDRIPLARVSHLLDFEMNQPQGGHISPNKIHEWLIYQAIIEGERESVFVVDVDTLFLAPGFIENIVSVLKSSKDLMLASFVDGSRFVNREPGGFVIRDRLHSVFLAINRKKLQSQIDLQKDIDLQLNFFDRVKLIRSDVVRKYYEETCHSDCLSFLTEQIFQLNNGRSFLNLNHISPSFFEGDALTIINKDFFHGKYSDRSILQGLDNHLDKGPVTRKNLTRAMNFVSSLPVNI
ncbi:MAG: hypothetical protein C0624_11310 [Desulfuromonas sp.]|nr:MAG: hypothetical protein C0624_11310 [Desulfuromonas sp.]